MSDAPAGRVVTLTLNPTHDLVWSVESLVPSHKLRVRTERSDPGGGGVNVSQACLRLGQPSVAIVALGGAVGQQVHELITAGPVSLRRIDIIGDTRQSIAVHDRSSGAQYRFVPPGPEMSRQEMDLVRQAIIDEVGERGWLVISGSLPPGVHPEFLIELSEAVGHERVMIDTSGPALAAAFRSGAYLVKPSVRELGTLVEHDLETEAEVRDAARQVVAASNVEVLVASIGSGGSFIACRDGSQYRLRAPTVRVASSIGAGDSMVAGMATALLQGKTLAEAVAYGVAAGSAAVMSPGTELCHLADVERLLPLVGIEVL